MNSRSMWKRLIAVLLCVLALSIDMPLSALASGSYRFSGNGDKFDIYVRVFVPGSKSDSSCVGHYDLMVKGAIAFHGKTFVNPCFSYTPKSRIEIFNEKDTSKIYKHEKPGDSYYGCSMYYWHFKISGRAKMGKFLSYLDDTISSTHSHSECSRALSCSVKSSSALSKYKFKTVNCFFAVATWLKGFGNNKLMKIYKKAYTGGGSYLPKAICKRYSMKKKG